MEQLPGEVSNNPPSEALTTAAAMLAAIAARVAGRETEGVVEMLQARPAGQEEALGAITALHHYMFPPVLVPEDAPLHEELGERVLFLEPGKSGLTRKFYDYVVLDAAQFDLTEMTYKEYTLPLEYMLNDPEAAGSLGPWPIYPGLAAYFLKAIVGEGRPERRRLVDLLQDSQLVQLVAYACVINKYRRRSNEALSDLDRQAKRLLLHLGGASDHNIAESEESTAKDTSHIRKSRRVMLRHLRDYSDLILHQVSEMAADSRYTLFDHDPIHGQVIVPEAVEALEAIVQIPERLPPIKIIESAMRRYAANALLAHVKGGEIGRDAIILNLQVIWLKVNGRSSDEITRITGVGVEDQDMVFLPFHGRQQYALPLHKSFWVLVHDVMRQAKMVLKEDEVAVSTGAISALGVLKSATPERVRSRSSAPTLDQAQTMSDQQFRQYIDRIVDGGRLLEYIRWAITRPGRWVQLMACREDPNSIITERANKPLPPELQARCINCTVRGICLGNALAEPPTSGASHNYAGYTVSSRQKMLEQAGLDVRAWQGVFHTDRRNR